MIKKGRHEAPVSPTRSSIHKSLQKRGLHDVVESRPIQWKRTSLPTRGRYEASNLLGKTSTLNQSNQVINIQITQINNNILQAPIQCTFRVKTVEDLVLAVTKKLDLQYVPIVYYLNDLDNEKIELTDIAKLPNPAKISVQEPDSESSFLELIDVLKSKVSIKDRRYHLKTYPNCFIGSEMVDCLVNNNILGEQTTREAAVEFGNSLIKFGYIIHVVDVKKPFRDRYLFYRFIDDTDGTPRDIFSLSTYVWGSGSWVPQLIELNVVVVSVACGSTHGLALSDAGKVYSWGSGKQGQLGQQQTSVRKPTLVKSLEEHTVQAIFAGYNISAVKTGETSLYTWGSFFPQTCNSTPKLVSFSEERNDNPSIIDVAIGYSHIGVLVSVECIKNGKHLQSTSVYTWGCNNYGQLGLGLPSDTKLESMFPNLVGALENVVIVKLCAGVNFMAALSTDGQVYAWGSNSGQCLSVDSKRHVIGAPRKVRGLKHPIEFLDCGSNYIAAGTSKGNIYTWGLPDRFGGTLDISPKKLVGVKDVIGIACGDSYIIMNTNTNNIQTLYSIGVNNEGQLGVDTKSLPATVPQCIRLPIDTVIKIRAGRTITCAVVTEDLLEMVISASQKRYAFADEQQKRKLLSSLRADPTGSIQISARKILRVESRHFKKTRTWSNPQSQDRFAARNNSRALPNKFDKQHFELRKHSSVFSMSISKYTLFDRILSHQHSTYKFLCDDITINSGGCTNAKFLITVPQSSDYNITAQPVSGNVGKESLDINFRIIGLRDGTYENYLTIDLNSEGLEYRHFVYFRLTFASNLMVPEIPFSSLENGQVLGSGAAGIVSKVQLNGTEVAVKQFRLTDLSVEEINSFRNEMLISSNLRHPNIIDCCGVSTEFPHLCLVFEFFPLKDLRSLITTKPELLTVELILRICMDIVEGMIYLHNRMIIHRDLKPDNVLMASWDYDSPVCAKLTDFGTSFVSTGNENHAEVGTARYMPLEVLDPPDSIETYDPRVIDVYSFGIVVWEMFSHCPPFENSRFTSEIIQAQKSGDGNKFKSEWDAPEELETLVYNCTSNSPMDRPNFESILVSLIGIAEGFSKMNTVVEELRKRYGHRRALTKSSRSQLLSQQLKTVENKIDKLNRREEDALQRLAAIQAELEQIREAKNEQEKTKEMILKRKSDDNFLVDDEMTPPTRRHLSVNSTLAFTDNLPSDKIFL